jgi:enterochelin esterase-like enzyme
MAIENDVERIMGLFSSAESAAEIRRCEQLLRAMISRNGSPVIRAEIAHFFAQATEAPSLVGDWNNWKPADTLTRLSEASSFYYIKKKFSIDSRLAYRMTLPGESILDPLNPNHEVEVFGTNSVVRMPAYREEPLAREPVTGVRRVKLIEIDVPGLGKILPRRVTVYKAGKGAGDRVLYVHDGAQTIEVGKFVNILDNLYYNEPKLTRCTVVFVSPIERDKEYMLNEDFAKYFAKTLVPLVESKLKIRPKSRGTCGSSLGGLLSAQLGMRYPRVFTRIAMQSPALWVARSKMIREYALAKKLPLQFFVHTGRINDAQADSRTFLRVLQEKGYLVQYRETNESHNWGTWRGSYADVVRWFVSTNPKIYSALFAAL